jgi:DNA-binding protein HU-beta
MSLEESVAVGWGYQFIISKEGGMTKAELVDKIARDSHITKKAAETALHSFVAGVRDSLKKGKKVTLVGFGTFGVARRAARNGRNPQTGEVIKIKAARVPRFKAGKALKDAVK